MQSSLNFARMFILVPGPKLGHVRSKTTCWIENKVTRSNLGKGHSFDSSFMKLWQNVYLNEI